MRVVGRHLVEAFAPAGRIDVANGIVRIVAVGTHAEYDRWRL